MSGTTCDHDAWLVLPWYRICLVCYDVDGEVGHANDGETTWDEFEIMLSGARAKPWVQISTKSEEFHRLTLAPSCLECGKFVVEEITKRADGTIATGFTCTKCGARWWAEESIP